MNDATTITSLALNKEIIKLLTVEPGSKERPEQILLGSDIVRLIGVVLRTAERSGTYEDKPEGARYIVLSDTLANNISDILLEMSKLLAKLWALDNGSL